MSHDVCIMCRDVWYHRQVVRPGTANPLSSVRFRLVPQKTACCLFLFTKKRILIMIRIPNPCIEEAMKWVLGALLGGLGIALALNVFAQDMSMPTDESVEQQAPQQREDDSEEIREHHEHSGCDKDGRCVMPQPQLMVLWSVDVRVCLRRGRCRIARVDPLVQEVRTHVSASLSI